MSWNPAWPEGNKSVKDNRPRGNTNMQYIQDTLLKDHYWDEDASKDGYHKQVDMPNLAVDPVALPSVGVNGQIYVRQKTVAETSSTQLTEPFFASLDGAVMKYAQLLGIRACAVFDVTGTLAYAQNITSVVQSGGTGRYVITYANALPTENYLVLGGGIRNSSTATQTLSFSVQSAISVATVKSTTQLHIVFKGLNDDTGHNPLQGWFVCFGG